MRCQRQGTRTMRMYSGRSDTGDVQHGRGDRHAGHCGAEIGLLDYEHGQQHAGRGSWKEHVFPVGDLLPARLEKIREIENDGGLGKLGRLKRQGAELDPAVRVMRVVEGKHGHQQKRGQS